MTHNIDSHIRRLGQAADTIILASDQCEDDTQLFNFLNASTLEALINLCVYYDCTTIKLFHLLSEDVKIIRRAREDVESDQLSNDSPV